jgi:hypothetical protein
MERTQIEEILRASLKADLGYTEDALEEAERDGLRLEPEVRGTLALTMETALEAELPAAVIVFVDDEDIEGAWSDVLDRLEEAVANATD